MENSQKIILVLAFGLILHQHQTTGFIPGLALVYDIFDHLNSIHDAHSKFTTPSTADLMDATTALSAKIDALGTQLMEHIDRAMETLLTRLPLLGEISGDLRLLNSHVSRIDRFFDELNMYLEHPEWYTEKDLRELLMLYVSHDSNKVIDVIGQMNALIVPDRLGGMKKGLFQLLGEESQGNGADNCDTNGPPQQRLLDLYDIILETEVRSFLMVGFGYMLRNFLDNETSPGGLERARASYITRVNRYETVVRQGMKMSSRLFRRCDPPSGWLRGTNYYGIQSYKGNLPLYAVSLRPMVADTDQNMVLTGIAFVIKNAVITLRIEVGQLGISGEILDGTAVWQEPGDMKWDSARDTFMLTDDAGGDPTEMRLDRDYTILSRSAARIHLDKISLATDEVITGVRFQRMFRSHMKPIQLQVRATRVDYNKGTLLSDSHKWIGTAELTADNGLRRVEYREADNYELKNFTQTSIDGEPYQFIDFEVRQSTTPGYTTATPLFDGVPVTADPRTPLGGLGIYHKKGKGHAGLLTFVLEGFDKSNYDIDASAPPP